MISSSGLLRFVSFFTCCFVTASLSVFADEPSQPLAVIKSRESIQVGGRERYYVISRPSTFQPEKRYALIVGFHGYRGEVKVWMHDYTQFEALIPDHHFIIVYPEAPISWSSRSDSPDLAFFDQLVAELSVKLPVDKSRVYALGHSNGAGFASALLHFRPKTVAAVAAYAGLGRAHVIAPDDPKTPLFVLWGENDEFAPAASDRVQTSIQAFRDRGYPVETWVVPGCGHAWGWREHRMEEKILTFFFKHTLPLKD
jgi:poly(3-hydroxybutyrate) depolymerase